MVPVKSLAVFSLDDAGHGRQNPFPVVEVTELRIRASRRHVVAELDETGSVQMERTFPPGQIEICSVPTRRTFAADSLTKCMIIFT